MSVKRAMMLAQRLYEGVDLGDEGTVGLITYMRTDSTRVSNEALAEVREVIERDYGKQYLPDQPNVYKTKHRERRKRTRRFVRRRLRGIRMTLKKYLHEDEMKVYKLDLAALPGLADGAGGLRSDHGGYRCLPKRNGER